jgi:hypothetical protein
MRSPQPIFEFIGLGALQLATQEQTRLLDGWSSSLVRRP